MRAYDVIKKKRDGQVLTSDEIRFLIDNYTQGTITDYQMAAFCMAVYFQGMTEREVADMTLAMANSGMQYDLNEISGTVIDKHSTGGVGDTTTLVVAPLVASCGVPIAKMSGRALGHTGGTIDKLESIPGFRTELSYDEFIHQVNTIKISLISQSQTLAPADKRLYALRDVTATVESLPLIASSIMSKKIAAGAHGFVLDVKTGRGALMPTLDQSIALAKTMVSIGKLIGKPTVALVTDMDQPLGNMVGNALEVKEAILTLAGEGPEDLTELSLCLGAEMLLLAGFADNSAAAYQTLKEKLQSKAALLKFAELIQWQGGNPLVIEDLSLLPQSKYRTEVVSCATGYVTGIDALQVGNLVMALGAGRMTKDSSIDFSVGIEIRRKVGDFVRQNQVLAVIHHNHPVDIEIQKLRECFTLGEISSAGKPLIYQKITVQDV